MAGPLFETPVDIQNRVRAQREAALANASPFLGAQRAIVGTGLDAVFGNPEIKKAEKIQKAIESAQTSLPPDADETTRELTRLMAARDAFAEAKDFSTVSRIDQQIIAMKGAQMEQRKLKAQVEDAEETNVRNKELHPLKVQDAIASANEYENWAHPTSGSQVAVLETDLEEKARLAKLGYVGQGKINLQGSKEDVFGTKSPVVTDLQTALLSSREQQQNIRDVMRQYDPSFTEWGTQLMNFGTSKLEKVIGEKNIPEGAKERLGQYVAWRRNTRDALNRYIKYITGAQMSQFEIKRIMGAFPTEDNGHTEFLANTREVMRQAMQAEKRASLALRLGLEVKDGDELAAKLGDLSDFEVSDADVDRALNISKVKANNGKKKPLPTDRQPTIDELVEFYKE